MSLPKHWSGPAGSCCHIDDWDVDPQHLYQVMQLRSPLERPEEPLQPEDPRKAPERSVRIAAMILFVCGVAAFVFISASRFPAVAGDNILLFMMGLVFLFLGVGNFAGAVYTAALRRRAGSH